MAQGTRRLQQSCIAVAFAIALPGCMTSCQQQEEPKGVTVKTWLETAVENVKEEWLQPCPLIPISPTLSAAATSGTFTVGDLLDDATTVLGQASLCPPLHNGLVDYLRPIVHKQKGKTP